MEYPKWVVGQLDRKWAASSHTHFVAIEESAAVQKRLMLLGFEDILPLWQLDIGGYDGHGPQARLFGFRKGEVFEIP